jgi:hypothetical protein
MPSAASSSATLHAIRQTTIGSRARPGVINFVRGICSLDLGHALVHLCSTLNERGVEYRAEHVPSLNLRDG